MKRISIIVLTYNSEFRKIFLTLESILLQNFKDYEIIIADDNSKVDNLHLIQNYFKDRHFNKYLFIKNSENKGTVENLLGAVKQAKGFYIKALGPGDLFYDDNSLQEIIDFMKKKSARFLYGKMQSYSIQKTKLLTQFHNFTAPIQSASYETMHKDKLLKSMLIKGDWISGATMVFDRDYLISMLSEISGVVMYCEDLIQVLVCLENEKIHFLSKEIIWYEFGEGISTGGSFNDKLVNDHVSFSAFLLSRYGDNEIIKKSNKITNLKSEKNRFKRRIIYLVYNPLNGLNSFRLRIVYILPKFIKPKGGFLNDANFKKIIKIYARSKCQ